MWFGSIGKSMHTFFFIGTLTTTDKISEPLVMEGILPQWVVSFCLVAYIMIASYTMMSLCTGIISESLVTSQQMFKHRKLQMFEDKRRTVAADLLTFLMEIHEDEKDEFGNVEPEDLKTSVRGDNELLSKLGGIGINVD